MAEVCEACGQKTVRFGASVFPGECDGDCGCLETQLDVVHRKLAAAHACIEAADRMREWAEPGAPANLYDTARAEYERVTKGEGER